jgi:hypothetical protein
MNSKAIQKDNDLRSKFFYYGFIFCYIQKTNKNSS